MITAIELTSAIF